MAPARKIPLNMPSTVIQAYVRKDVVDPGTSAFARAVMINATERNMLVRHRLDLSAGLSKMCPAASPPATEPFRERLGGSRKIAHGWTKRKSVSRDICGAR